MSPAGPSRGRALGARHVGPRPIASSRPVRAALIAAVSAGAFLVLGRHAGDAGHAGLDAQVVASVGRLEAGAFEGTMVLFSFLGAGVGLMLLLTPMLVGLLRRRRVADTVFVSASLLTAQVVGRLAKDAIDRPRPPRPDHEELTGLADLRVAAVVLVTAAIVVTLATRWRAHALAFSAVLAVLLLVFEVLAPGLYPAESRSFPSGHATSSMAFAATAATLAWSTRWRWPAVAAGAGFVVLVGLSRIALAVHYPSDVAGGWCLAVASVALVWLVVRLTTGDPTGATSARSSAGSARCAVLEQGRERTAAPDQCREDARMTRLAALFLGTVVALLALATAANAATVRIPPQRRDHSRDPFS